MTQKGIEQLRPSWVAVLRKKPWERKGSARGERSGKWAEFGRDSEVQIAKNKAKSRCSPTLTRESYEKRK